MLRKNNPAKKEVYRLWYEYLTRSERYREFCEWARSNNWKFAKALMNKKTVRIPQKFQDENGHYPVATVYLNWGDLHFIDYDFDLWFLGVQNPPRRPLVMDGAMELKATIERQIERFKEKKGRVPSLEEFKEGLFATLNLQKQYFFIYIWPDVNVATIEKEFGQFLRKKQTLLKKLNLCGADPQWLIPTQPLRYEEVKRYLEVYDLHREGKKWREVARAVYPKMIFNEDLRTRLIKEERKASIIIENV